MTVLRSLFASVALFLAAGVFAQEYEPRDTWPYVYDNFVEGSALTKEGQTVSTGLYNVTVTDGSLHFIGKDETIMKADMAKVHVANLAGDRYLNILGRMYRVLVNADEGFVLEEVMVDYEAMREVSIGYGITSATASATRMSGVIGTPMNIVDQSFMKVVDQKSHGSILKTKTVIWINVNGLMIEGTKNAVSSWPGVDKKEAKAFFKANRPKWNDASFLAECLKFVAGQINK